MSRKLIISLCGAIGLASSPAFAAVDITEGPGAIQPEENVLINTADDGPADTITGSTNQSGAVVRFNSLEGDGNGGFVDISGESANGQAVIETDEGSSSVSDIEFLLDDPDFLGFTEFEFNLFKSLDSSQDVTITAEYVSGLTGDTYFETFDLDGNGQNYFSGVATEGDYFTKIIINASGTGSQDLRQVRLGGLVFENPVPGIPEPSTWLLMLFGFAAIGGFMRSSRKNEGIIERVKYNF